jgi:hypothetical protein
MSNNWASAVATDPSVGGNSKSPDATAMIDLEHAIELLPAGGRMGSRFETSGALLEFNKLLDKAQNGFLEIFFPNRG